MSIQSVWIHARSRGHCGYDRCWSKDDMIVAGETEEEHDQSINSENRLSLLKQVTAADKGLQMIQGLINKGWLGYK